MTAIAAARARIDDWMMRQALPLWAGRGIDDTGRFHEALDFGGDPLVQLDRRTMVQSRQIAVFAQAAELGWDGPARAIVERGLARLIETAPAGDGLWRHATRPDGAPAAAGPDLYDHAFVLFALAGARRTLGDARSRSLALETLAQVQARMADPVHGGWQEALPPRLPRRQNPHMHLLEAMLAWMALDPAPVFRAVARDILTLFETRFFDPQNAALGEFYGPDWTTAPGAEGQVIEPGHHFEWVWLLTQAGRAGLGDFTEPAQRLYDRAMRDGFDHRGFVVRELARDGGVLDGGRRLWAQTEAIRAITTMGDAAAAAGLVERVLDTHLATATPGLWVDSYDAAGRLCNETVPASTLYHLMTAFSAMARSEA